MTLLGVADDTHFFSHFLKCFLCQKWTEGRKLGNLLRWKDQFLKALCIRFLLTISYFRKIAKLVICSWKHGDTWKINSPPQDFLLLDSRCNSFAKKSGTNVLMKMLHNIVQVGMDWDFLFAIWRSILCSLCWVDGNSYSSRNAINCWKMAFFKYLQCNHCQNVFVWKAISKSYNW